MPRIYISVGSNVDRDRNIRSAHDILSQHFSDIHCSPVYESAAVGFTGEPFLNLVIAADTGMSVDDVDRLLTDIEDKHGRIRSGPKFSPRTLDLDLLLYGNDISTNPAIELPRSEIERYAFVLRPLADIAPQEKHPVTGKSYAQLWSHFDQSSQPMQEVAFNWNTDI